MIPCELCEYAKHLRPEAIEAALDEYYEKWGNDEWDYYDEVADREMRYCHPCPYEYAWDHTPTAGTEE